MSAAANVDATVEPVQRDDEPEPLGEDDVYHLLQCSRRRDAIRYLRGREDPVVMREMAEQIAAWEHDTTVAQLRSKQRQRVYIPLYQRHLPKLDSYGVIEYDQDRGVVRRTERTALLERYLDPAGEPAGPDDAGDGVAADRAGIADDGTERAAGPDVSTVRWDVYYLGASVLGVALLGGAALDVPVFSALSGLLLGVVVFVMYCALTVGRVVADQRERLSS